jgi:hypothetical protein
MMGAWSFTDTTPPELTCGFIPTCLFCGSKLTMKNATTYRVQMTGQDDPDPKGRAIDVSMICPECRYVEVFGVALSSDEAGKING